MSTTTTEEKAKKKAERFQKRLERLRTEMRKDVETLRKILGQRAKPA